MIISKVARLVLAGSIAFAASAPVHAEDKAATFSPGQEQAIRKIVRDYLIKNPEVISEAIAALRQKQEREKVARQTAAVSEHRKEIFTTTIAPIGGNPNGTVTIVEFFDYNCGWCKRAKPILDSVIKNDGKVRVVYKEFPILGSGSVYAAQAALAARKQGKYVEFHNKLMSYGGRISPPVVLRLAKEVGLDVAKLQKDLKDPEITKVLRANYDLAKKIGVEGTPAFVIGTRVTHFMQPDQLQAVLDDARRTCKAEKLTLC